MPKFSQAIAITRSIIVSVAVPLEIGMEPFPGHRLLEVMGRGSFAEVWKAERPDGGQVALKFLTCETGRATPGEIRSIQFVRQLEHSNLTRVERVWCHLGYIVIAMELAEGSLLDLLEAHRADTGRALPLEHVCFFLAQVAEGLDFLNARQHRIDGKLVSVQHCDIKPSNMLLFGDTVKLCDFGIATMMTASIMPHRLAGTPSYASPEIFRSRLSNRSDQYALAVSYCQLRGGRLPFPDSPSAISGVYARPRPDLSMLPPREHGVVQRALSFMPQDRWPSSSEFIENLANINVF
jgi:serine/threonine-protein kinase